MDAGGKHAADELSESGNSKAMVTSEWRDQRRNNALQRDRQGGRLREILDQCEFTKKGRYQQYIHLSTICLQRDYEGANAKRSLQDVPWLGGTS